MTFRFRVVAILVVLVAWACGNSTPTPVVSVSAAQSGATIAGSVVDSALNPLAGVAISLEQNARVQAKTQAKTQEVKTTTGADGRFRFAAVAAGDYLVRAELAGFAAFSKDIRVAASATALQLPIVMTRPSENEKREQQTLQDKDAFRGGAGAAPPPVASGVSPPPQASGTTTQTTVNGLPQSMLPVTAGGGGGRGGGFAGQAGRLGAVAEARPYPYRLEPGETYTRIEPNRFTSTSEQPLSTFGADVDTASYSNVRRFLTSGQLPPHEAVRVEELINYFTFPYAAPRDGRPIALATEIGPCPWAPSHNLVLIGARAAEPAAREITGRNLVLLIDVSGSMAPAERLPLIKTALGMFVDTLRPNDTLSIVTYAGESGIALYPTPARQRDYIQSAISGLHAGGSTNGGQGLILAYRVARQGFIPGGVNRVILATDGDFNVGITSQGDLLNLIERERDSGVFLSVFGVGSGNLKDRTMEMLADKGNGNYSYLDSLQEARRVLIREGEATLNAVAKDVKFQVEFNPAVVAAWKLIGYENRALRAQDFNNDRKDAGEMGAGHTVTALYEVVRTGVPFPDRDEFGGRPDVDPLRYQPSTPVRPEPEPTLRNERGAEWLTVKARYKLPEGETSQVISMNVRADGRPALLPFASAVAELGLLLRDDRRNLERWDDLSQRLANMGGPMARERQEFRELVELARGLARIR